MNFFSKVKGLGQNVINKIKTEVQDFMQENNDLIQQDIMKKEQKKKAKLPWLGLRCINSQQNGNMTDIIREEMLALTNNQDNFLIDDENYMYNFEFSIDEYIEEAILIQEHDVKLAQLRKILVPKKITDEKFWKNYFYNIEIIKLKYNMENKIVKQESKPFQQINIDNNEQKAEEEHKFLENDNSNDNQESENLIIKPEEDEQEDSNKNEENNNQIKNQFIELTNQEIKSEPVVPTKIETSDNVQNDQNQEDIQINLQDQSPEKQIQQQQ